MNKILYDKYVLGQSNDNVTVGIYDQKSLNVKLKSNNNSVTGGQVYGTVKDSNGNVLKDVLIKLMTSDYHPLNHVLTDSNGNYSFSNLSTNGGYTIFAIANGFKLNQDSEFNISSNQSKEINFILDVDPSSNNSVIAGSIIDSISREKISGAIISLFSLNADNSIKNLKAITYSSSTGNFTFREVPVGNYSIKVNSIGYTTGNANISISTPNQVVPIEIGLTLKQDFLKGTISGYIKDPSNTAVDGADVILYKVDNTNALTPIAFTKTINTGFYLFTNVPNGNYKIKSTDFETVTVKFPSPWTYSPHFHKFTIESLNQNFKQVYSASDAILYGAAIYEDEVIKNVGSLLGYFILANISVPVAGDYNFIINYVCADENRVCNISINNKSTGQLYGFETTGSWQLKNAKDKTILLPLKQGTNIVKIYNK